MTPQDLKQALTQDWVQGEHAELREATVTEPVNLDGLILRSFDLSTAQFGAGLSARNAEFRGMAWLHGAKIAGTCDFSGATFRNDLRLDGLTCDHLILDEARFEGVLSLDHARIGKLSIKGTLCLANLSLAGISVADQANLSDSILMGGVWARDAEFGALNATGLDIEGRRIDL